MPNICISTDHHKINQLLIQHKAYFLRQLNADSLYPFACWSLWLLCLLILMLIILMLILIESRSMLIVYWLGDRKLIKAYLTPKQTQQKQVQSLGTSLFYWKILKNNLIECSPQRCYKLLFPVCVVGDSIYPEVTRYSLKRLV